jgi:NDP-sugar pyrophosphorylase family protein
MSLFTVLITTSGTGERLKTFTKYTNKALVNVGDKYAICYIIENYPIDTEYVITLGYYGDFVRQFLLLAYPNRNFTFIEIDCYEGPGSSLGYSLLQTQKYLQKPFIFHCCDAVIRCPIFDINNISNTNQLCVYKSDDNISYTSVVVENENEIKEINPKGYPKFDFVYTGISYIYNYSLFWICLEKKYQENKLNSALSDVDAIHKMITMKQKFTYILLDENNWYDTGNMKSYHKIQDVFPSQYSILFKSNESLCFMEDNRVIKFNHDKLLNKKRVKRGKLLGKNIPIIMGSSDNYLSMEKIDGKILSEYYVHGEVGKLLIWAKSNLWNLYEQKESYRENCRNFYIKKTLNRIRKNLFLYDNENKIIEYSVVNGIIMPSIFTLMEQLETFCSELILTDCFHSFHGDFILDNIIKTKESYKLIDWRQEFDDVLEYGDIYYDLAKLRHNLYLNHKNIANGLFTIEENGEEIVVDLKCNYFLIQQLADYEHFVNKNNYSLKKIKIITALIWLNMSSLYEDNFGKFLFYFGKYNLFLSLNEIC